MTTAKFLVCVGLNDWKKHFLSVLLQITPPAHWFTHRYCRVTASLKMKFFLRHCIAFTDPEQIHSKTRVLYTAPGNTSQDKALGPAREGESQICKALLPGHLTFLTVCLRANALTISFTTAAKAFRRVPSARAAFAVQLRRLMLQRGRGSRPAWPHAAEPLPARPCFRRKGVARVWSIGTGGGGRQAKDKGEASAIWSAEMKTSKSSSSKRMRMKGTGTHFGGVVCLLFRIILQRMVKKENFFCFFFFDDRMQTAAFVFTSHLDSINVPCDYTFRTCFS